MKFLKSRIFDDVNELTHFVNENRISTIQQITEDSNYYTLFYWEEEKLHVPTSRKNKNDYELNATEKYDYAYQQAVDDMNGWR